MQTRTACDSCGASTLRCESARMITLPIAAAEEAGRHVALAACLLAYAQPDWLTGANAFLCVACSRAGDGCTRSSVAAAPAVLTIQLRRFVYGGQKDAAQVDVPVDRFDLAPCLTAAAAPP